MLCNYSFNLKFLENKRLPPNCYPKDKRRRKVSISIFKLSFVTVGSAKHQHRIRHIIWDHILTLPIDTSHLLTDDSWQCPDVTSYVEQTRMRHRIVYGIDVELHAISSLANVNVFVFNANSLFICWFFYKPSTTAPRQHFSAVIRQSL